MTKLKRLIELSERATAGPWEACPHNRTIVEKHGKYLGDAVAISRLKENRDYVASANPETIRTMAELLSEARELIDRAYGSDYGKEWLSKFDKWNEGKE